LPLPTTWTSVFERELSQRPSPKDDAVEGKEKEKKRGRSYVPFSFPERC
jgi:hypothetical protein